MKNTLIISILLIATLGFTSGKKMYIKEDGVNVVVIDAGHGGRDPGNLGTGRYKTREKDIALPVAIKVGNYIKKYLPDVKVIYTRNTDVYIELEERARIANRANADLFISIHCDAFTKSSVHGCSSFVMGKEHDDDNLRVAKQENSVIFLEENYEEKYEGFDPNKPESYIALSLYQSAFMQQSISFAQKVQDQFRERVQRKDRGVKQQPLMVTKMAVMPAVLIELGFLTNPTEEDFLNSEKGQDYMASAIYRAFKEYKEEREMFSTNEQHIPVEKPKVIESKKEEIPKTTVSTPTQKDTPKPVKTTDSIEKEAPNTQNEIFFSVQILTSGLKKELIPQNFKGVEGVNIYTEGGLYKYIVGNSKTLQEAEILKQKMKNIGFTDAFVVALKDGKRISIADAKKSLQ